MREFFVFDTNSLVSAALKSNSVNRKALDLVIDIGSIAASKATVAEFMEVLFRKKFDKYFENDDERLYIIERIESNSKLFKLKIPITACRDPKDDKFLELAVAAKASFIITGDEDLLVLNPFRGISILKASEFLDHFRIS